MACKTADDVCNLLLSLGFKEYPGKRVRTFYGEKISSINCDLNDRPPSIHCIVHNEIDYVMFNACGSKYDPFFVDLQMYQYLYKDITEERIEKVTRILTALWETYCKETKGE